MTDNFISGILGLVRGPRGISACATSELLLLQAQQEGAAPNLHLPSLTLARSKKNSKAGRPQELVLSPLVDKLP